MSKSDSWFLLSMKFCPGGKQNRMRQFQNSKALKEQGNLLIKEMGEIKLLRECVPELFSVYIFKFAAFRSRNAINNVDFCLY